jgi:hypothetical protein
VTARPARLGEARPMASRGFAARTTRCPGHPAATSTARLGSTGRRSATRDRRRAASGGRLPSELTTGEREVVAGAVEVVIGKVYHHDREQIKPGKQNAGGWPGQLVVRVAQRQEGTVTARPARLGEARPMASRGFAARTTSCPGHPAASPPGQSVVRCHPESTRAAADRIGIPQSSCRCSVHPYPL